MSWIYYLRFPNGKGYVGQTRLTLAKRWQKHQSDARTGKETCTLLMRAWRKYGEPTCTPLFTCPVDELNAHEAIVIRALQTLHPGGYNLTTGGESGTFSDDARARMSASAKRRPPQSAETRARISASLKGRSRPPAVIARIAASNKGTKPAAHTIAASVAARVGKPLKPAHRAQVLAALARGRASMANGRTETH